MCSEFLCVCAVLRLCHQIDLISLLFSRCRCLHQHLFASEHRDDIIRSAIEHAGNFIGIMLRLRKEALTFENVLTDRLGKYSSDESITSLAEFVVQKITPRHPVRTFVLSLFTTERRGSWDLAAGRQISCLLV